MSPIESQRLMLSKMTDMQQIASDRIVPADITADRIMSTEINTQFYGRSDSISGDFKSVVRSINEQQNISGQMMAAVDTGRSDDVVGAMVASQKASLSFSMLMEIRNKVLNGVDDVMRMSL
ncbi:flagellar hook-basal body complex protein FliE [Colwellia sp. 1_MG-2023]|uniref:flagellar hook-basal body complex protein FliE n=1 Tax=unclassified Colwellia TaxID=196834 RepID=UPI001C0A0A96|nr:MULTISPECIES: flagellar hook-basal body complex protein FliE [unclassified Colwellia]MBU2926117.1 flagellar hook-basal body complex protein FliE [Colwellia sp. C2M11]MDO6652462.1 flagellar hook-basal body complex protein FliE [Colwellia sp. 3_MG-2023]MDO6665663.1 flagellar hook-basal body complex protein FliE [Colwellia sp. 2_MG-2023]MDO6690036.1 flagellar hook-basal body complex protein FliE [Colwellia sp. 1_MG-2023]